jgi:hypothetical protein
MTNRPLGTADFINVPDSRSLLPNYDTAGPQIFSKSGFPLALR